MHFANVCVRADRHVCLPVCILSGGCVCHDRQCKMVNVTFPNWLKVNLNGTDSGTPAHAKIRKTDGKMERYESHRPRLSRKWIMIRRNVAGGGSRNKWLVAAVAVVLIHIIVMDDDDNDDDDDNNNNGSDGKDDWHRSIPS